VSSAYSCSIQNTWQIAAATADAFEEVRQQMLASTGKTADIISGFRTDAEQIALGRSGRPTAPVDLSTHTTCPATGIDIRLTGLVTDTDKRIFGRIAESFGFRWGGGSQFVDLIPLDWNHLDLGPRGG